MNDMRQIDADALLESAGIFEAKVVARGCGKSILHLAKAWLWNEVNKAPTIDAVPVVRCDECVWYKPPHFAADDGTEHPWDGMVRLDARSDGIHVGGKCKHERNTAYGEKDMAFRKPDDFCSYGERKDGDGNG